MKLQNRKPRLLPKGKEETLVTIKLKDMQGMVPQSGPKPHANVVLRSILQMNLSLILQGDMVMAITYVHIKVVI